MRLGGSPIDVANSRPNTIRGRGQGLGHSACHPSDGLGIPLGGHPRALDGDTGA